MRLPGSNDVFSILTSFATSRVCSPFGSHSKSSGTTGAPDCSATAPPMILSEEQDNTVRYTYSVYFTKSDTPWGLRWDHCACSSFFFVAFPFCSSAFFYSLKVGFGSSSYYFRFSPQSRSSRVRPKDPLVLLGQLACHCHLLVCNVLHGPFANSLQGHPSIQCHRPLCMYHCLAVSLVLVHGGTDSRLNSPSIRSTIFCFAGGCPGGLGLETCPRRSLPTAPSSTRPVGHGRHRSSDQRYGYCYAWYVCTLHMKLYCMSM